ncbi:hypothetical protein KY084_07110 [Stakelama sp. CBK3Z-3]|uniref:Autotransporter outer membrane beta-barrel domain-containing protein n=1 Tax=Stakelama flava TaxID=2860338 RepID=A0ABS6XMH2_9SPHN|nr:hypothetical protein [Stakelama flava]MBW4330645.1 hypothetical protein [Stakelama flava]
MTSGTGKGRPLRFAGSIIAGWTMVRVGFLWFSTGSLTQALDQAVPLAHLPRMQTAGDSPGPITAHAAIGGVRSAVAPPAAEWPREKPSSNPRTAIVDQRISARRERLALAGLVTFGEARARCDAPSPRLNALAPLRPASKRWQASGWIFYRPGGGDAFAANLPSLGGSQAGFRAAYTLDTEHRLSASLRVAAPLAMDGAELMAGIAWQPFDAPVTVLAEERFGLDHQGSAPSLTLVGGQGPEPVAPGVDMESYGEIGAIARDRIDYFAGASLRLSHKIARVAGQSIRIGTGAWGGIQRGAKRLDIGPSLSSDVALAGGNARLSIEWRQRVAGNAAPGSGLALTLGTDF